jgi:GNAT superfamily N-acetyltransferase
MAIDLCPSCRALLAGPVLPFVHGKRTRAMNVDAVIRKGTPADALAAAEVWLRSRKAAVPAIPEPRHTDDEVRHHFQTVLALQRELWVAVDDTNAAVTAVLVLDGAEVDQLYVDPEWWGHGIGSRLIEHAQRLRPHGLWLWTFQTNTGARRFYERHGFVAVYETDGSGNEERAPDVRYAWTP